MKTAGDRVEEAADSACVQGKRSSNGWAVKTCHGAAAAAAASPARDVRTLQYGLREMTNNNSSSDLW
jgi:hypothetical protein